MSTRNLFTGKSTSGFTLIELIIVLVIIGMLAAVVVSKLDKVPDTADAVINEDNVTELNKFIQIHASTTGLIPDQLDTLTDAVGASSTIDGPWNSSGEITVGPATAGETKALSEIGLKTVVLNDTNRTQQGISSMTNLAKLDPTKLTDSINELNIMGARINQSVIGSDNYFVFGMGQYNASNAKMRLANIPRCPAVKPTAAGTSLYDHYLLVIKTSLIPLTNPAVYEAEYVGYIDPVLEVCKQF